ncbi:hypothetical protein [Ruicaihuangia caeni]|uniref:DNA polymerase III subunit gamma/tau n=1 Tax=Ruicaihuangia caeni TaxID=3042517 RepID=A0AAW6T859_9MICO|nr:hypothetical protein [Klugiella sp. YN-L-19]MDI2097575.1 hypothetical protein [Klugiella sp. YN-L-19]
MTQGDSPDDRFDASDDEALRWAGDESLDTASPQKSSARGALSTGVEGGQDASNAGAAVASSTGGALQLVALGVIAGIYVIYSVGWVAAVFRDPVTLGALLPEIMYQLGEALAIVAPAVWFAVVLVLTRGRRPLARFGWLAAGLVLLVPLPWVLGSAA